MLFLGNEVANFSLDLSDLGSQLLKILGLFDQPVYKYCEAVSFLCGSIPPVDVFLSDLGSFGRWGSDLNWLSSTNACNELPYLVDLSIKVFSLDLIELDNLDILLQCINCFLMSLFHQLEFVNLVLFIVINSLGLFLKGL